MPERELPWPPLHAPTNDDVALAWDVLHDEARKYMLSVAQDRSTRRFLKKMQARNLQVLIQTEGEYCSDVDDDDIRHDHRPFFGILERHDNDSAKGEGQPNVAGNVEDELADNPTFDHMNDDHGDLGVHEEECRFCADTKFCVTLSYEHQGRRRGERQLHDYSYRDIALSPQQTLHLICKLKSTQIRKTIADALVFKFIEGESEDERLEEAADGGIDPDWRGASPDPAADALIICTHLQTLYKSILEGENGS